MTYYLEVISSWCHWAEPAWAELKQRYAGRVEFDWKLALMDQSGLPVSRAQCEWFYRRSGTIVGSPYGLNAGWFDPELNEYLAPNLVAEAARDFGQHDDTVRLAIANAAVREGLRVGEWIVSATVAADAAGIDLAPLLERARSPEIEQRARATTAEFHALGIDQRPAFMIENSTGDRAIFSGIAAAKPLIAAVDALLQDETNQLGYAAEHGAPPSS